MPGDHKDLLADYASARQALAELAAIYDDSPIGMAVIGADFRFQRINTRLASINGAPVGAHLGRTVREVVPKLADLAEVLVRRIVATGEPLLNLEIEGETAAHPGVLRSFVENWSPIFGPGGDVVAVNVVVEDVTVRKQSEQALAASEARLREVLDTITEAFLVMDYEFRIIQLNREALRIDGRSLDELAGRSIWDIWPALAGTPLAAAYERVMKERVAERLEARFVSPELDLWLDVSAYPTSEGVACFYREISERKRAEQRLSDSERRLSMALQAGQLGVYEYAYGSSPTYYWDETVRRIWGVTEWETLTNQVFWSAVHADDLERVRVTMAAARQAEPSRFDVEYRIHRVDDKALIWIREVAETTFDDAGPVRTIGTVQDITDRKSAEEQALMLMREVNHRSKNLLAVVQSIAHQMARTSDPDVFAARFAERLSGLASSQDLLVHSQWKGVALLALITSQLAHYQHLIGTRIRLSGEVVHISPNAAQSIGMALHELATNATKYGALSGLDGEVMISWKVTGDAPDAVFSISWVESGGPPVTAPARRGLGTQIISRLLERSVWGEVLLEFDPSGLRWSLRAPAHAVVEAQ